MFLLAFVLETFEPCYTDIRNGADTAFLPSDIHFNHSNKITDFVADITLLIYKIIIILAITFLTSVLMNASIRFYHDIVGLRSAEPLAFD